MPIKPLLQPFMRCLIIFLAAFSSFSHANTNTDHDANIRIDRKHIQVVVAADGSAVIETLKVTTLLTTNAIEWYGEEKVPFGDLHERAEVLEAFTELPDGSRVAVQPDAIRLVEDDVAGQVGGYSDAKAYVVIFPRLSVGAKIHLRSRVHEHTPMFNGHFFFYTGVPVTTEHREVVVDLIHDPAIRLLVDTSGEASGIVSEKLPDTAEGQIRYRVTLKNHPPIKREDATVSLVDISPYVQISSIPDMVTLGALYQERSTRQEAVTPSIQALADQITAGITDPMEQVRAIHGWITREMRYVAILLGDGAVVPKPVDEILRNRYGDCKDHNTIFISLLTAKGIQTETAIVNLGRSYHLPKLGGMVNNNHVITYLPQFDLYVDATNSSVPVGMLAYEVADKPTILTKQQKLGRTPRATAMLNRVSTEVTMQIQPDGRIVGESRAQYVGPVSIRTREYLIDQNTKSKRASLVQDNLARQGHAGTGAYQFAAMRDLSNPVDVRASFEIDPVTNFPGPGAMVVPVGLSPGRISSYGRISPLPQHRLPYACTSYSFVEQYRLTFPDTSRVTRLPAANQFESEGHVYRSSYQQDGQAVIVSRELVVDRPKSVCQPGDEKNFNAMLKVIQRDLRGQIFYE